MTWHGRITIDDRPARRRNGGARQEEVKSSFFLFFSFYFSLPAEMTGDCEEMKRFGVCGVFEGSGGKM